MAEPEQKLPLNLRVNGEFIDMIAEFELDVEDNAAEREAYMLSAMGMADGIANALLSAPTNAARAAHTKAFLERLLETINTVLASNGGAADGKMRHFFARHSGRAS